MPFLTDVICNDCGYVFEDLRMKREDPIETNCPSCDGTNVSDKVGTATAPVTVVRGNSDFAVRQRERLYQRSSEHFKKEGRDEAIERQRMQWKKEGMLK